MSLYRFNGFLWVPTWGPRSHDLAPPRFVADRLDIDQAMMFYAGNLHPHFRPTSGFGWLDESRQGPPSHAATMADISKREDAAEESLERMDPAVAAVFNSQLSLMMKGAMR